MDPEQVTVIVPTRNEADNILPFLRSLPQGVSLIVVDASEDATPHLMTQHRPLRTQVLREQANVTEARQLGAAAASTPWLLFTDADVSFAPDYADKLRAQREGDVLYGVKLSSGEFASYYRRFTQGQRLADRLGIHAASGSNLLIRRDVFWDCGGFDLRLTVSEDSEIAWRIKRHGYSVRFVPDLVVCARDHRRLYRGTLRKTLHSLTRCVLLYTGLMPERWRNLDWGYWFSD